MPFTSSAPSSVRRSIVASGRPYGGPCAATFCAVALGGRMRLKVEVMNAIASSWNLMWASWLADLHREIQERSADLLEPMRLAARNHQNIARNQTVRFATVQLRASDFIRCHGLSVEQLPSGQDRRRTLQHVQDVGVFQMDLNLPTRVTAAAENREVPVFGSFKKDAIPFKRRVNS